MKQDMWFQREISASKYTKGGFNFVMLDSTLCLATSTTLCFMVGRVGVVPLRGLCRGWRLVAVLA